MIGGGGGGGLAAAWGLATQGYDVTLLEECVSTCLRQSGITSGGQARRHRGAYQANSPRVAAAIREDDRLADEMPEVIVPAKAIYYVPASAREEVTEGWKEGGVQFTEVNTAHRAISPAFRKKHELSAFETEDQVIDTDRTRSFLEGKAFGAGARLVCNAEIVGSKREGGRVKAICARTPDGFRTFDCDLWINVTGASLERVASIVNPEVNLRGCFELSGTPVLRMPWPFDGDPLILQFYGKQLLQHLSVIPVGSQRLAAVATSGGQPATDHETVDGDLEEERDRLLQLMAEGFDLPTLPQPQTIAWCVKALFSHPAVKAREGDSGARLVTVVPGTLFGGLQNEIIGSPGKLGSILHFRDAVIDVAAEVLGEDTKRAAA